MGTCSGPSVKQVRAENYESAADGIRANVSARKENRGREQSPEARGPNASEGCLCWQNNGRGFALSDSYRRHV